MGVLDQSRVAVAAAVTARLTAAGVACCPSATASRGRAGLLEIRKSPLPSSQVPAMNCLSATTGGAVTVMVNPWVSREGAGSAVGGDASELMAQDEGVHLVGALVGAHAFKVVCVPQWGVLQGDAVATEDGAGLAGDLDGLSHVVQLADRDLVVLQLPGVLESAEMQGEQEALVDLQGHVDQFSLGELVAGQGLVELHSLLRVGQRGFEGIPGRAHCAPHD